MKNKDRREELIAEGGVRGGSWKGGRGEERKERGREEGERETKSKLEE